MSTEKGYFLYFFLYASTEIRYLTKSWNVLLRLHMAVSPVAMLRNLLYLGHGPQSLGIRPTSHSQGLPIGPEYHAVDESSFGRAPRAHEAGANLTLHLQNIFPPLPPELLSISASVVMFLQCGS